MKAIELEKAYDPKSFEDRIYSQWKESGAFQPEKPKDPSEKPYVIVIPPPNVTGMLHLGHGLNISLQDIVIRFHRMRGEPTLWVPGTDHAGIATQNVVEKKLKARGTSRRELGREKFLEETWKVKQEHHEIITRQLSRLGASVDWSRERFTLDEGLSRAVRDVFVTLYERDLLYKGNYLVNWCSSCGTALSDDEVEHEETSGKMYHIRYPYEDGTGFVELATTRPETLLGDTAVAVNPDDERYKHLIGKTVILPLANRPIPVIADAYVEKDFGTGVVKITPAHDPNDWDVGKRHDLPVINILTPDGRLNDSVPEKYRGMTVKEARKAVLEDLTEAGFFIKDEDITHAVGHCYRCNTVIEPFLSEQWFVRMKPLAEKALAAWRKGDVIFYPKKWENTYQHWLENIRDWCISRQLWWGHRIPAWYCETCGKTTVARENPDRCAHCGSAQIEQDPDVLDTWFSSWLWPFSTLGWPEETDDYKTYYPTTALVTAYDIIFFWVSRMIMAGLEFTGQVPFRDIYIHGLLRDKQGRKMSKSLGNGLDPLELVDEYGADSVKFTLAFMCAQGQDLLVDKESFKLGSKFANKIWNASRYILMNLEGRNMTENPPLLPVDTWIYGRLNGAARAMNDALTSYRYNDAALTAYEYFWNDFCDWYVEATKLSMRSGDDAEKDRATTVLLDVLAESLRLIHPLLPFVTEEIYEKLPNTKGLLITARYPEYREDRTNPRIDGEFSFLQELIRMIRTLRSECTITPDKKVRVLIRLSGGFAHGKFLQDNTDLAKLLAGIGELEITDAGGEGFSRPEGSIGLVGNGFEAFVYIADAADMVFLKQKFTKDLEKDRKFMTSLQSKLANGNFTRNAPAELVEGEKRKLEDALKRTEKLESYIRDMA
ncbi:valine--tRNA ligase [Breznakiella homolactica]|uniref:Valine--tRNA ligase n=1 Tax=Breznakiella homolactica TaxID=2798577 RepID=A0A7T7XRL5_9SPIR|nr:valine--tRNA ligase [Breznakiella homolactica]QQO11215.1 valine--tRNA ligase [Breznakiella homolactica]